MMYKIRILTNIIYFLLVLTSCAARPMHDTTPSVLNKAEPTTVPTPKSDCVMNVPMMLINNSGVEVATAINVAPATS